MHQDVYCYMNCVTFFQWTSTEQYAPWYALLTTLKIHPFPHGFKLKLSIKATFGILVHLFLYKMKSWATFKRNHIRKQYRPLNNNWNLNEMDWNKIKIYSRMIFSTPTKLPFRSFIHSSRTVINFIGIPSPSPPPSPLTSPQSSPYSFAGINFIEMKQRNTSLYDWFSALIRYEVSTRDVDVFRFRK